MAQSMSDSQVLEYVKDGIRQGKEQKQLASELARKGVTKEQAMRVKQLYEQQNNVNTSKSTGTDINESRLREETKKNTSDMLEDHPTTQDLARGDQVFGRNIFNTRNLTFEPSVNLATPTNYRLGPGDEVIIDIWGASQNTIRQQISPEGTINIQKIGPVNLSGMTVSAANDYLKNALNKIYNGLNNTTDPTSDIRLTLGNIRTIQINVMGEVVQPGTYALSSFSTVFHALYRAGGVSDIGSLRNVQLVRKPICAPQKPPSFIGSPRWPPAVTTPRPPASYHRASGAPPPSPRPGRGATRRPPPPERQSPPGPVGRRRSPSARQYHYQTQIPM